MTTLLLLLMLHGFFLALVLTIGRRQERGNLLLAAVILNVSLLLLQSYLAWSGLDRRWPHLLGTLRPFWFSVGPLVYAYVATWSGRGRLPRPWLLTLPSVAVALVGLPFYLLPAADKLAALPNPAFDMTIFVSFTLLTGACALAARRAIHQAAPGTGDRESSPPPWRLGWLRWLMGALVAYAILDFAGALWWMLSGAYPPLVGLLSLGLLTALVYSTGILVMLPDGLLASAPWPGRKYQRSTLGDERGQHLANALETVMREERPWLDEGLRLDVLALRLETSRHELSQIINQHLGTSFHDYVNRHRVAEAKRQLLETGSRQSILDIGLAAGFGSSASFYRAFKKHAGSTPKDFLARAAGSSPELFRQQKRDSA